MNTHRVIFLIKQRNFGKIIFVFLGLISLIGWNAILTSLDYFNQKFDKYNVQFEFPIPFSIASLFISLFIYKLSTILSNLLYSSQILMSLLMIIILIVPKYNQDGLGYVICMILCFFIGLCVSMLQTTIIAFASIFSKDEFIGLYFQGTGISGIIICLTKIIFVLALGSDFNHLYLMTLGYFSISIAFLLGTIFLYIRFRSSSYCRYYIKISRQQNTGSLKYSWIKDIIQESKNENDKNKKKSASLLSECQTPINQQDDLTHSINQQDNDIDIKKNKYNERRLEKAFLINVFKKIFPLPLNILIIFIQTFMLFPGIALEKFFTWNIQNQWNITILLTVFNIFDTLGKTLGNYIKVKTKLWATIFTMIRFVFFFTMIYQIYPNIQNPYIFSNWFSVINMTFFAFTNGYLVSINMIQAPQNVDTEEKETAGFMMSFPIHIGILFGSLLSQLLKNIGK